MATLRRVSSPRKYWEDKAYAPIAALGLGAVMFALALGAVLGLYVGDLFAGEAGDPQQSQGVVAAWDKLTRPIMFFGASLLMTAVVVVLRRIRKTIEFERGEAMKTHLPTLLTRGGS